MYSVNYGMKTTEHSFAFDQNPCIVETSTRWSYDTERKLLILLQHNDKEPFKRRRLEIHRRQSRREEQ